MDKQQEKRQFDRRNFEKTSSGQFFLQFLTNFGTVKTTWYYSYFELNLDEFEMNLYVK